MEQDQTKQFKAATAYALAMNLSQRLWKRAQDTNGFSTDEYRRHRFEIEDRKSQALKDYRVAGGKPLDFIVGCVLPDISDLTWMAERVENHFGERVFVDLGSEDFYIYCHCSTVKEVTEFIRRQIIHSSFQINSVDKPDMPGIVTWTQALAFLTRYEIEPEENDFSDIVSTLP